MVAVFRLCTADVKMTAIAHRILPQPTTFSTAVNTSILKTSVSFIPMFVGREMNTIGVNGLS